MQLTLTNGKVINMENSRNAQFQGTQTPKNPPTNIHLIKRVDTVSCCTALTHYKERIYVGTTDGTIYSIDQQGFAAKALIKLSDMIMSFLIHDKRIYSLLYGDGKSTKLCVNELSEENCAELTSWDHPALDYFGQQMFVTDHDLLAVGDPHSKQIIIYSLPGDVIRKVPCPHSLTMTSVVCMCSCGNDSVIISDMNAGKIVRVSLKDGSLLWSSDRATSPGGIVHHPAGYVLAATTWTDPGKIFVLDQMDGGSSSSVGFELHKPHNI